MLTSVTNVAHNSQNDLSFTSKGPHIQTQKKTKKQKNKKTKKNTFFIYIIELKIDFGYEFNNQQRQHVLH